MQGRVSLTIVEPELDGLAIQSPQGGNLIVGSFPTNGSTKGSLHNIYT